MPILLKVTKAEFAMATPQGEVSGKLMSYQPPLYAYTELGEEKLDYIPNRSDPHTRYRCFRHCNVFYAKTAQDCVEGRFIDPRSLGKAGEELRRMMTNQTVVIYN